KRGEDGIASVSAGNSAAVEAFEPGSVAKVFSLSSVIDTGTATPETVVSVPGRITFDRGTKWEKTITDAEPHGRQDMTLHDIIVHSSNIGTLQLADEVGVTALGQYLNSFGFGQPTGLGFPDESGGIMKPTSQLQGTERQTISFGYGYSATALQLIAAANV